MIVKGILALLFVACLGFVTAEDLEVDLDSVDKKGELGKFR